MQAPEFLDSTSQAAYNVGRALGSLDGKIKEYYDELLVAGHSSASAKEIIIDLMEGFGIEGDYVNDLLKNRR